MLSTLHRHSIAGALNEVANLVNVEIGDALNKTKRTVVNTLTKIMQLDSCTVC